MHDWIVSDGDREIPFESKNAIWMVSGWRFCFWHGSCSHRTIFEIDMDGKDMNPGTQYTYMDELTFDLDVIGNDKLVVVEFGADWCGGCKIMGSIVDTLSHKYSDQVRVVRLDFERSSLLVKRYSVQAKPTYLFVKDGKVIENIKGTIPREEFESILIACLGIEFTTP